ncbi:MAG: YhbY family RNA-binding protein [Candidatus Pacearchaeota archaeon]
MTQGTVQLGKNGLTSNFIETLRSHFDRHANVKVSVLKGAGHDREKVKKFNEEILEKLGKNYTSKIVGFSIFLKKWRKSMRE